MNYTLIGEKLGHSYSAIIHSRYFELLDRCDTYTLTEITSEEISHTITNRQFDGMNVTIPYKREVAKYLDSLSPEAEKIGAVNTVKYKNDKIIGFNTDYFGLKLTLKKNDISLKNKRAVILGTGGASEAVYAVCRDMGAESVAFVSRAKVQSMERELLCYDDKIYGDVLFNATPVGMYPNIEASPLEAIPESFSAVVDLIYNPSETLLIKKALAQNIKAVNGLYMLVAQALKSESIWNDEPMRLDIADLIYEELKAEFEKRK